MGDVYSSSIIKHITGCDINYEKIIPIICISPLNGDYSLFDIALDHELRHAIEMSIKKKKNSYLIKMGTDISEVDFNFDSLKSDFTNYNERVTQKLSIEACRERWMKGQFIFSDPYSLINTFASPLDNDALYDELPKHLP